MNKFKKINLKLLKNKFDYEKFYKFLTTKVKASNGKFNYPVGVISELENNLGITNKHLYEKRFSSPQSVFDVNFPLISIEDGSLFNFLNKKIECETLFAAKQQKYQLPFFFSVLSPFKYYFLFNFRDKDKKVLTHMHFNPDFGWDMDVEEIFDKGTKLSNISKKLLNKINKIDCICYQFIFFSKSLKPNIRNFVKKFEKDLVSIEPKLPMTMNFIRSLDMYICEIDPKIKIPFLSNIEFSSIPNFNTKNKSSKINIELKTFKKGNTKKLLGKKIELKSTKKFKVKPLFIHRFLKEDWIKKKGKLTGSIYL